MEGVPFIFYFSTKFEGVQKSNKIIFLPLGFWGMILKVKQESCTIHMILKITEQIVKMIHRSGVVEGGLGM
jgi:hypothetical protein